MNYAGILQDNNGNNYYPEDKFKRAVYSNTSIKKGSLELYKYGRIIFVYCIGDAIDVPNGNGEPYITGISEEYLPLNGYAAIPSYNNIGYVFLEINNKGNAIVRNYTGKDITVATNCGFMGCYMSAK